MRNRLVSSCEFSRARIVIEHDKDNIAARNRDHISNCSSLPGLTRNPSASLKSLRSVMDCGSSPRMTLSMLQRLVKISEFEFQTAKRPRSRAAARVGLLGDLPFLRGDGAPKDAPW
jgi:hypothetical protein